MSHAQLSLKTFGVKKNKMMVPALKLYIPSEKPTHLRLCERVRSCCPDPGVSILVLLVPVLGSLLIVSLLLPLGPFPMSSHSFSPYWDLHLLYHFNVKLARISGDLQFWHIGEAW